jgi:hypothetical protein
MDHTERSHKNVKCTKIVQDGVVTVIKNVMNGRNITELCTISQAQKIRAFLENSKTMLKEIIQIIINNFYKISNTNSLKQQ